MNIHYLSKASLMVSVNNAKHDLLNDNFETQIFFTETIVLIQRIMKIEIHSFFGNFTFT